MTASVRSQPTMRTARRLCPRPQLESAAGQPSCMPIGVAPQEPDRGDERVDAADRPARRLKPQRLLGGLGLHRAHDGAQRRLLGVRQHERPQQGLYGLDSLIPGVRRIGASAKHLSPGLGQMLSRSVPGPPPARRVSAPVGDGMSVSAVLWGGAPAISVQTDDVDAAYAEARRWAARSCTRCPMRRGAYGASSCVRPMAPSSTSSGIASDVTGAVAWDHGTWRPGDCQARCATVRGRD